MLQSTNKLEFLTQNDWVLLNSRAYRLVFKLGDAIIREGSVGDVLYIIRSGTASVELTINRVNVRIAELVPDDICGDMAFLDSGQSTATVIARDESVEVDALRASDLRDMFESFPGLGLRFYRSLALVLARRLRATSKKLARPSSSMSLPPTSE